MSVSLNANFLYISALVGTSFSELKRNETKSRVSDEALLRH